MEAFILQIELAVERADRKRDMTVSKLPSRDLGFVRTDSAVQVLSLDCDDRALHEHAAKGR
jgi:hypothetical protein